MVQIYNRGKNIMNSKERLVMSILTRMSPNLPPEVLKEMELAMYIELNNFSVSEPETSLAVLDDSETVLKKFIATKRLEGRSEKTIELYLITLKKFFEVVNRPLREIENYDIRYYLAIYKETRQISNITLDNMRRHLSIFFRWAYDEGFIPNNPMLSVGKISYEKKLKAPFTQEELERIRWGCENVRDLALVEFLYSTGCRVSEVVALNISDINFAIKEVIVLGKGNKQRIVYLTDACCFHLKRYFKTRNDDNPALFVSLRKPHKRFSKGGIEAALKRLSKITGVENIHPHRYRRTLATLMIMRGADILDVSKVLGHADVRTTQVYCCSLNSHVKNLYQKLIA